MAAITGIGIGGILEGIGRDFLVRLDGDGDVRSVGVLFNDALLTEESHQQLIAFHVADRLVIFESFRITSYNVCYTKLLRIRVAVHQYLFTGLLALIVMFAVQAIV